MHKLSSKSWQDHLNLSLRASQIYESCRKTITIYHRSKAVLGQTHT